MIRSVTIETLEGMRRLDAGDFPLAIGSDESCPLRVAGTQTDDVVALIGLAEGAPYVQPSKRAGTPVRQNGRVLLASSWLQDGDCLDCGGAEIRCRVSSQRLLLRLEPTRPQVGAASPEPGAVPAGRQARWIGDAPPLAASQGGQRSPRVRLVTFSLVFVFGLLLALAWFLFTARFVPIAIKPAPDRLLLDGGLIQLALADGYLLYPGHYRLRAEKSGYHPLETIFEVPDGEPLKIAERLRKLPGKLRLGTGTVTGATVRIDGALRGRTPLLLTDLNPGPHDVLIQAERYFASRQKVVIEGMGIEQRIEVSLTPRFAPIAVKAKPSGAWLWVDGERVGTVPLTVDLLQGSRELELRMPGFKLWRQTLEVVANQPQTLPEVHLEPAGGTLHVISEPAGASVTVGGDYAGQTPLELRLPAGEVEEVRISKAGYETVTRSAVVPSGTEASVTVTLSAVMGTVEITVEPADAKVFVDGKAMGAGAQRLSLVAMPHSLDVRKPGYRTFRTRVTPRHGYPQVLNVRLERAGADGKSAPPPEIEGPDGNRLRLLMPATITMGASRREQGRRGNETLRKVALTRPFYVGVMEVTNGQFRQFDPKHSPAPFQEHALGNDGQPVVNITWEQAAEYCNWLSEKASLPTVYERKNGKLVAKRPLSAGYRLPTEAEWARAARYAGPTPTIFPWGSGWPPPIHSGNYADESASTILGNTIRAYNDGYATTAPVGSFEPNPLGLYDLEGNVAEWTHDVYTIYPAASEHVQTDPVGPVDGRHHVIRGAGWKGASLSALRWAFRDYGDQGRVDVGFRIARSAD